MIFPEPDYFSPLLWLLWSKPEDFSPCSCCGPFTARLITPSPLRFLLHAATGVRRGNESCMRSFFCSGAPQGLFMSLKEMRSLLHHPHGLQPGLCHHPPSRQLCSSNLSALFLLEEGPLQCSPLSLAHSCPSSACGSCSPFPLVFVQVLPSQRCLLRPLYQRF